MQVKRLFPLIYKQSSAAPDLLLQVEDSLYDPTGQTPTFVADKFSSRASVSLGGTPSLAEISSSVDAVTGETFWCFELRLTGFDLSSLAKGLYQVQGCLGGEVYFPTSPLLIQVM